MSIYRRLIVAVAALGLATSVFAADEMAAPAADTNNAAATTEAAPAQTAEATPAASSEEASKTEASAATSEKLDVNKASAKELMKLKGVSAAKAKAIVSFRKKHGEFKSLDDLKEVKGFKKLNEKKMQEIQDQLTVG